MKQHFRTARNILAVMMAVLLVALTASVAAVAEGGSDKLVLFVNEFATESVDPFTDLTNYKAEPETVKILNVAQGEMIYDTAEGAPEGAQIYDKKPVRGKDEAYGEYEFAGWVTRNGDVETPAVFPYTVNEDTTFYATFTGKEVEHSITFRSDGVYVDADGNLQPDVIQVPVIDEATGEQKKDPYTGELLFATEVNPATRVILKVAHGGSVTPPANNPTRADSGHYKFVFKEWDYDYEHVYKDGSINAVYDMVGKDYKFKFYDYDGSELGDGALVDFVYGEKCENVPEVTERFSDEQYQYYFNNEWNTVQNGLQTGTGEMIDMDNVKFQNAVEVEEDGEKYIKVYAQYWQQLIEYYFSLYIIDPDGEPAEDVAVQVSGPENQLLNAFHDDELGHNGGVGRTDASGRVTLSVPYSPSYTISAYDSYYNLAAQVELTLDDIKNDAQISLQLKEPYDLNKGQQYCNDICHSFFGGVWITGLNLFYRLFKVKYVCCYDMYAAHGDRLAYTSGSAGRTIDRS